MSVTVTTIKFLCLQVPFIVSISGDVATNYKRGMDNQEDTADSRHETASGIAAATFTGVSQVLLSHVSINILLCYLHS